jgi:mRNA interferase MazF
VARFVKGDVVVVLFPFTDLTKAKRRPALVITELLGDDVILCQITSRTIKDSYAIELRDSDFLSGKIKQISNIRPNRIFTADKNIIFYKIGSLKKKKFAIVIERIVAIIRSAFEGEREE